MGENQRENIYPGFTGITHDLQIHDAQRYKLLSGNPSPN
jgi:hypothetical protein